MYGSALDAVAAASHSLKRRLGAGASAFAAAAQVAVTNIFVVTTATNSMALNMLLHARRYAPSYLDNTVGACMSNSSLIALLDFNAESQRLGFPCIAVLDASTSLEPAAIAAAEGANSSVFHDPLFNSIVWQRYVLAEGIVAAGYSLLMHDVDVVIFRDLRPALLPYASVDGTIFGACDPVYRLGDIALNTGVLLLHPGILDGLQKWIAQADSAAKSNLSEQDVLQMLDSRILRTACLPQLYIGLHCNYMHRKKLRGTLQPADHFFYHYNCLTTTEKKVAAMKADGTWILHARATPSEAVPTGTPPPAPLPT